MDTAAEIILSIEKHYAKIPLSRIKNLTDNNSTFTHGQLFQFILGVTPHDLYGSGIDSYRYNMRRYLPVSFTFECLPWPFEFEEITEAKSAAKELAGYYEIDGDIENLFAKLNFDQSRYHYIVITIVAVNFLSTE